MAKKVRKRILRAGVVGCGKVAREYYLPCLAEMKDVTLVAFSDLDEDKAKVLAQQSGANYYVGLDDMLENEDIDTVFILTGEQQRLELLQTAFSKKKNVFSEVPLLAEKGQGWTVVEDVRSARKVISAWKKARACFGVNFNLRFAPHIRRLKADIDSGRFGQSVMITAFVHLNWWAHCIDLTRFLCGEIREVYAYTSGPEDSKHRVVSVLFERGTIGSISGSSIVSTEQSVLRIEYIGTKARGVVEDLAGSYTFLPYRQGEVEVWRQPETSFRGPFARTFLESIARFVDSTRSGRQPEVSGLDALKQLEIDSAITLSEQRDLPVKVQYRVK